MTKDELLKLADRVEAGNALGLPMYDALGSSFVWGALEGSLDAAKALHDAVLPGWVYGIEQRRSNVSVYVIHPEKPTRGNGDTINTVAAAWVAAILRAKAGEVK